MFEMKQSGIKPPSKIDRPGCTVTPKPTLPPRSMNTMEPIWETHGRRLSEAGVRRGSDNSVILTEDTDSFIIGEHVWVGGTKPGKIAYIGETQFAPGDWAGIVLEEPIGKNDGSVSGCRYFQCEPKRGIFSRLTKLTRQPVSGGLTSPTGITSPVDSVKGSLNKSMTPSLNTSTTSLSSISQKELQVGERVIVSSSQGSKTGYLRYIGTTEFAAGDWCGIDLDEPIGKNDGSVNDKRYFECRPKYGLFAPLQKVSRSPSNRRSHCLVHRPTGAALNMSLRKMGSRESLASVGSVASVATSVASRATNAGTRLQKAGLARTAAPVRKTTQDIIKEKQAEIETLRKERDLERERVTKVANQADEAEKIVLVLKKEFNKYREESEKSSRETQENVIKLLEEKNLLVAQLEDERRKCEDLLFRFEEESINKDDIQKEHSQQSVANSIYENKIKDLEYLLSEERERVIQLETETTKLFETEEELTKLRIEIQNATAEEENKFSNLQERIENLEKSEVELKVLLDEKTKSIEKYIIAIKELHEKLKEKVENNINQENCEPNLNKQLKETYKQLQERWICIQELSNKLILQTEQLQKENEQSIKFQTSLFNFELEKLFAKQVALEKLNVHKNEEIEELTESKFNHNDPDINELRNAYKNEHEEKLKLKLNIAELTNGVNSLTSQLNNLSEYLKNNGSQNSDDSFAKNKDIITLRKEFEENIEIKNKYIQDISDLASQKSVKLNMMEKEVLALKAIIENKNEELNNQSERINELQDALTLSKQTISNLESELHIHANQIKQLNEKSELSDEKIIRLTSEKEKLKDEISHIIATSVDSSDKFIQYNEQLRHKEKELDDARNKELSLKETVIAAEAKTNMIEEEMDKLTILMNELQIENEKIKSNIVLEIQEKQNVVEKLVISERIEQDLINKNKILDDDLKNRILELSDLTNTLNTVEKRNSCLEKELTEVLKEHKSKKHQLEKQISEGGYDQIILKENIDTLEKLNAQLLSDQQAMDISMKEVKENLNAKNQHVLQLESLVNNKDLQLKEIMNNFEIINMEKEKTKQSLLEINSKYNDALAELNALKSSNTNLGSQMSLEVANLKQQLEDEKNTLDTALKESKNYLDELTKELAIVSENNIKSNQKCTEMESIITSKDKEIQLLNESLNSEKKNNEMANQELQTLQNIIAIKSNEVLTNANCITSLNLNIKTLESNISILKSNLEEKINVITELENMIVEIKNSKQNISSSIKEKDKEINELIIKHEQELKSMDTVISRFKNELKNKEKIIHDFSEKNTGSEQLIIKYKNDIALKDEIIDNLRNSEEIAKKAINEFKDNQKMIDELITKHEDDLKLKDKIILELQNTKKEMDDRIQNFKQQFNYIHEKCTNLEESQKLMEIENKQLVINHNETVAKLNISNQNLKNSTNNDILKHNVISEKSEEITKPIISNTGSEFEKLKEEYDLAKDQINFLNSVIVDMQCKNETLSCKIQVLEMGIPPQEVDDYNINLIEKKTQPLRMFCDICDQFDLHETDDCPKQAQDPEPIKLKSDKKVPVQRPYCENCEMFGHDTLACDETETY